MQDALIEQINAELYSAYLYLAMAAEFESQNLKGMASWMEAQAKEETEHAKRFYDFVNDRGGRVTLKAIDAPPAEWKSPAAAFRAAYEHEQKVSAMIHNLVDIARSEKDKAAEVMLDWFVNEQVEEEATASEIAEKLERIKESANGVFMMDNALGKRE
ncbi:MAG: ferritin [Spirochaetales bacterium]|nr:ferritin [Spirochaetales bacterium]